MRVRPVLALSPAQRFADTPAKAPLRTRRGALIWTTLIPSNGAVKRHFGTPLVSTASPVCNSETAVSQSKNDVNSGFASA